MSRSFNKTSDKAVSTTLPIDFSKPFGVAAWFNATTISGSQAIVTSGSTLSTTPFWILFLNASARIAMQWTDDSGATRTINPTNSVTAGAWQHTAFAKISSTSRAIWLNGTGKTTDTNSLGNLTTNRFSIGNFERTSPLYYFGGLIANVGIWDLTNWGSTDAEKLANFEAAQAAMARGVWHEEFWNGLVGSWRLGGNQSPEPDSHPRSQSTGNYPLTLTGTSKGVSNPPVVTGFNDVACA